MLWPSVGVVFRTDGNELGRVVCDRPRVVGADKNVDRGVTLCPKVERGPMLVVNDVGTVFNNDAVVSPGMLWDTLKVVGIETIVAAEGRDVRVLCDARLGDVENG